MPAIALFIAPFIFIPIRILLNIALRFNYTRFCFFWYFTDFFHCDHKHPVISKIIMKRKFLFFNHSKFIKCYFCRRLIPFWIRLVVIFIILSYGELQFPPTAVPLQIKFGINFIPSTIACRFQRHVFICPIDHSPSFLYSLIVTNKKRERTAPTTVRSSSHSPRAAALIRCRVMP